MKMVDAVCPEAMVKLTQAVAKISPKPTDKYFFKCVRAAQETIPNEKDATSALIRFDRMIHILNHPALCAQLVDDTESTMLMPVEFVQVAATLPLPFGKGFNPKKFADAVLMARKGGVA